MDQPQNKYQLEHIFANDFSSPIFPLLADLYYKTKEYERAKKVCFIGLQKDPENSLGLFILSKIYILEKKNYKAEQILKQIVNIDPCNIAALLELIEIERKLKRSKKTIALYVKKANKSVPNNKPIKKLYSEYLSKHTLKIDNSLQKSYKKNKENLLINKDMATKSMFKLMMKQKKIYNCNAGFRCNGTNSKKQQVYKSRKRESSKKYRQKGKKTCHLKTE